MKAVWNNTVIAESNETIEIEGNQYFPPSSVKKEFLEKTDQATHCPWKGEASYYSISSADGDRSENAAWYYSSPSKDAVARVGADFADYVAFYQDRVSIQE